LRWPPHLILYCLFLLEKWIRPWLRGQVGNSVGIPTSAEVEVGLTKADEFEKGDAFARTGRLLVVEGVGSALAETDSWVRVDEVETLLADEDEAVAELWVWEADGVLAAVEEAAVEEEEAAAELCVEELVAASEVVDEAVVELRVALVDISAAAATDEEELVTALELEDCSGGQVTSMRTLEI
jgi:hypothetical protein